MHIVETLNFDGSSERFDLRRPFTEMGMDSLLAIEMRNAIAASLDITLPATVLFDYPTMESLVTYLSSKIATDQPDSTEQPVEDLQQFSVTNDSVISAIVRTAKNPCCIVSLSCCFPTADNNANRNGGDDLSGVEGFWQRYI